MQQLLNLLKEYSKIKGVYLTCYSQLATIRDETKEGTYSMEELVNLVYISREISKLTNDLRKETDGIVHILEQVACVVHLTRSEGKPIRASLATGSPSMKLSVNIPHRERNPEDFEALMNYFGIDLNSITDRAVRPHWPAICEMVSVLAEEGKPLPPGINPDKTYPTYTLRITAKRDLDELLINFHEALQELQELGKEENRAFEIAMNE